MAGRAKPSPLLAVEGGVPAPAPIYRAAPLLGALARVRRRGRLGRPRRALRRRAVDVPVSAPAPWLFLALVPSIAAILLAVRGIVVWSLALAIVSCWLVPTGIATIARRGRSHCGRCAASAVSGPRTISTRSSPPRRPTACRCWWCSTSRAEPAHARPPTPRRCRCATSTPGELTTARVWGPHAHRHDPRAPGDERDRTGAARCRRRAAPLGRASEPPRRRRRPDGRARTRIRRRCRPRRESRRCRAGPTRACGRSSARSSSRRRRGGRRRGCRRGGRTRAA